MVRGPSESLAEGACLHVRLDFEYLSAEKWSRTKTSFSLLGAILCGLDRLD